LEVLSACLVKHGLQLASQGALFGSAIKARRDIQDIDKSYQSWPVCDAALMCKPAVQINSEDYIKVSM